MRLIDADAFIDDLYEHEFSNWCDKDVVSTLVYDALIIDIVFCKECKWFDADENESDSWHLCTRHFGKYINFADDDFCSYGEREGE